jgi:molybdopterin synthase sulfur carrier subunit
MSQSAIQTKHIKVVFFAALREQLQCETLNLDADDETNTVDKVKLSLLKNNPNWHDTLSNVSLLSAINHTMSAGDDAVKAGDEVAFFPPVTGG